MCPMTMSAEQMTAPPDLDATAAASPRNIARWLLAVVVLVVAMSAGPGRAAAATSARCGNMTAQWKGPYAATTTVDAGETNVVIADNLAQFVAQYLENLGFRRVQNLAIARAPEETADDGAIVRSAVRKLVVDERCGKHAVAGAARNQKSETGRKRAAHLFVVSKRCRHR